MATRKVLMSGFGGQGIMVMGELASNAAMLEGNNVTWLPSYGPEMRGGAANCGVVISDELIGAPNVTTCDDLIVMNEPSLIKFESAVKPGGNLFINSALISSKPTRTDIHVYYIPVNKIAEDLGNSRVGNMVMLGAFVEVTKIVKTQSVFDSFLRIYGERKRKLLPLNQQAFEKGAEAARETATA